MKLVIASNNPGKLREIREIMTGSGIEIISQREAGCDIAAEETGDTFDENARIKALAAMRATGLPAAADDSGLEVSAMNGGPGVYSSRYCGDRSYAETCTEIIGIVDKHADRSARYCCAVVCCFPDGREVHCFATTEGEIARELRGSGGFGYDPMFLLPDGRTMAELSETEKNAISHRGRAFRELLKKLKDGENNVKQ